MTTIKTIVTPLTSAPIDSILISPNPGHRLDLVDPGTYTLSSIVDWYYKTTDTAGTSVSGMTKVNGGVEHEVVVTDTPVTLYLKIEKIGDRQLIDIAYDLTAAEDAGGGAAAAGPTLTYKAADDGTVDVTFNSEVPDTTLKVAVEADDVWLVEGVIFHESAGGGTLAAYLKAPAGSVGKQTFLSFAANNTGTLEKSSHGPIATSIAFPSGIHAPTSEAGAHLRIQALVRVGGTAGDLVLCWGNAGGAVVTMKANSYLSFTKVS